MKISLKHFLFLFFVLFVSACQSNNGANLKEFTGATMGTSYSIKIVNFPVNIDLDTLFSEITGKLEKINNLMSTYKKDSELSRFNQYKKTTWFNVSKETESVISEAINVADLTSGAFDITVGPLVNLWGFGPKSMPEKIPSSNDINKIKNEIGFMKIKTKNNPPAVKKELPDIYIDLSGIAKGFGVDYVAEFLETKGIGHYMVEIGGEVRAKGKNQKNMFWKIGIEKPDSSKRNIQRVINLSGLGMATSGDYRNYFEQNGKRYSHMIDPKTGYPITHTLASVTVLDPKCMKADALATGLMVLGFEKAYALAIKEKLVVFFIIKEQTRFIEKFTPEFKKLINN